MSDIICPRLKIPFSWEFGKERLRLDQQGAESFFQISTTAPGENFHGTRIALAHDGQFLYVVAELEDSDIYNAATELNQRTWMTGDVFEIFLRPEMQEAYYEFHVTPENRNLQLRIPGSAFFYARGDKAAKRSRFDQCLLTEPIIKSRTEVLHHENLWRILASIPLNRIVEGKAWSSSDHWLVSFSRYDYTRGKELPVLSSTSARNQADFHDQSVWRRLVFHF